MPNVSERTVARARAIIRENLRRPVVPDDAILQMPKALLRTRGMKLPDSNTLVIALLHQVRGEGMVWEIAVSWRSFKDVDAEAAFVAAGLFLKAGEMQQSEFEWHDSKPLVKIAAPYIPEIDELEEYEGLTRELPEYDDFDVLGGAGEDDGGDDESPVLH